MMCYPSCLLVGTGFHLDTCCIDRIGNLAGATGGGHVSKPANDGTREEVGRARRECSSILEDALLDEGQHFPGVRFHGGITAHFGGGCDGGAGGAPDGAIIFDVARIACRDILPGGQRGEFLAAGIKADRGHARRARFCYFCHGVESFPACRERSKGTNVQWLVRCRSRAASRDHHGWPRSLPASSPACWQA